MLYRCALSSYCFAILNAVTNCGFNCSLGAAIAKPGFRYRCTQATIKTSLYSCVRYILSSALLFICNSVYSEPFPRGCEVTGFGYNSGHLVVNETGKQSFYLIQNRSTIPIKMQRVETRDIFMSPPLTIQLDPSNWAAFASDVSNFHFECLTTENETITNIDCRDILEICEYPRVKFALSNMGNYWVSVNKSEQQQIINDAVSKGIYLKW